MNLTDRRDEQKWRFSNPKDDALIYFDPGVVNNNYCIATVNITDNSELRSENNEGCVGKSGLDKNISLEEILEISYKMNEKHNIIIKAGPRAKWYLKRCPKDLIDAEIEKQRSWRDISRSTMWIIDWDV